MNFFHFNLYCYDINLKKRTMLQINQQAPDFTLFDSDKNKVTLSAFAGNQNVLLLFFPLAFTGVCTRELCSVRDDIGRYDNANARVLGISVDSVYSLAKFKQEQAINFPLLSDFNKEVSTSFECIYDSFTDMQLKGVSKRSAFIIDKEGVIKYVEVLDNAGQLPDFTAINNILSSLA